MFASRTRERRRPRSAAGSCVQKYRREPEKASVMMVKLVPATAVVAAPCGTTRG